MTTDPWLGRALHAIMPRMATNDDTTDPKLDEVRMTTLFNAYSENWRMWVKIRVWYIPLAIVTVVAGSAIAWFNVSDEGAKGALLVLAGLFALLGWVLTFTTEAHIAYLGKLLSKLECAIFHGTALPSRKLYYKKLE